MSEGERYRQYVRSMLESYADVSTKVMFGDFTQRVKSKKDDEFATFALYLNTLIASLERKEKENINKTQELEESKELEKSRAELQSKINELERFNNLMVGRELKMVELKKRIDDLEGELKIKKR